MREKYSIDKLIETSNHIYESYSRAIAAAAKHSGIKKCEADMLLFFFNNPGLNRLSDIEKLRGYQKVYIDESVSSLVKNGLLEISDKDTVGVTGKGGIIGISLKTAQQRFLDLLLSGITPDELAIIESIRRKIGENVEKMQ